MNKKFEFDEPQHIYTLERKRLYGVTSVLGVIAKPALIQWAANMAVDTIMMNLDEEGAFLPDVDWKIVIKEARTAHRKKKEDAGKKGTDVHALCEAYIKGCLSMDGEAIITEEQDPQVKKFMEWAVGNKVKFTSSEKRMYSETMWVAGTADFTCVINGKNYVGDIKTSSGIYGREYFLQCAGYMIMLEEMGEKYDASIIVRLGKDGSFETKESHDVETDKKGFRAALDLFKVLEQ